MYKIVIDHRAEAAIFAYVTYIAENKSAPLTASKILQRIFDRAEHLKSFPTRSPIAPESSYSKLTIRMLRVDNCLLLYTVNEDERTVNILRFRHGKQREIEDIGNA